MKNKATKMVVNFIMKNGEDSISIPKRQDLIDVIKKELEKVYRLGKQDAIDKLFPELNDYNYEECPLRKAAIKIIFDEK